MAVLQQLFFSEVRVKSAMINYWYNQGLLSDQEYIERMANLGLSPLQWED